mmetsp:Transcript_21/g.58  ORF Transcript_21/g.58 Transcript_21/m.58 type:complete len:90 (-) Transcript_21:918-1187(-)
MRRCPARKDGADTIAGRTSDGTMRIFCERTPVLAARGRGTADTTCCGIIDSTGIGAAATTDGVIVEAVDRLGPIFTVSWCSSWMGPKLK